MFNWRKIFSIAALSLVISGIAVIFTSLQWYESYRLLEASMKPSVGFDTEYDTDEFPIGIAIENSGPAPARIQSISYYVDRKQVANVDEAVRYGHFDVTKIKDFMYEEGDTIAVGEKQWLIQYTKKAKVGDKEFERFADWIDQNLAIKVHYCSLLAEGDFSGKYCWDRCSTKGRCE
jgi:hypothetical protein